MIRQIKQRLKNMRTVSGLISKAGNIANEMGDRQPAAEHLVLAAFEMPDGLALRAFQRLAGEPDLFSTALAKRRDQILQSIGVDTGGLVLDQQDVMVAPPAMPGAQISAQQVLREMAGKTGFWQASPVTGMDVLSAVVSLRGGLAADVLESLGVNRQSLSTVTLTSESFPGID